MNLHDLDGPRMAPDDYFTPEMLRRLYENYGTYTARVHVPEGATVNNIRIYAPPRWTPENAGFTVGEWDEEIAQIRREALVDTVHEVRQGRDGYWRYEMRVTDLGLPRRIDGVFLDTET